EHGFVFGNGLWVTSDGGEHWSAAAYPGGSIMSLEITDRQVLAVTMRRGIAGNASWALLRRPLAGGAWTRLVTQASAIGNIATQARVGGLIDRPCVPVPRRGGRRSSTARPCWSPVTAASPSPGTRSRARPALSRCPPRSPCRPRAGW